MQRTLRLISILALLTGGCELFAQQTIRCSSDDGRRAYCRVDTRGTVRLAKQISGSPCIRDKTWGVQADAIWVDRGCRADFLVGRGGNQIGPGYPGGGGGGQRLSCASNNGLNLCRVSVRGGVRLVRQNSKSPCIQDRTWGVSRDGIWVDKGCRADFVVGAGGVGPGSGPGRR